MLQISLRSARESSGYTAGGAANYLGISIESYEAYENNPGTIPKIIACKIKKMYGILLEWIEIK